MLSENDREKIALKKFSLIAPVLNGQVENVGEYFRQLAAKPVDMPCYGVRYYAPKTFSWWLLKYRRSGLEGLKPGYRTDRGKSRKVTPEIAEQIRLKKAQKPNLTGIMLYDELVKDGVFTPDKLSISTFYRFLARHPELLSPEDAARLQKECKRFAHQWVNELWQTDIMYGLYLKVGKSKRQTYLISFIDDASRLVTHSQFFLEQNFSAIRIAFKEAVLKRGIPKTLYTDNGKVYRCGQLSLLCAGIGCSLLHTQPFDPAAKGKIERFHKTVQMRFLNRLELEKISSLDELNLHYWQWLENDYNRKIHSAIGMSPLDYYLAQADRVKMVADPAVLEEHFLLRTTRKVHHDATFTLNNILYETETRFANLRVEVRYDPEWLSTPTRPVYLYLDGIRIGTAHQVDLSFNATMRRKRRGRPCHNGEPDTETVTPVPVADGRNPQPAISFTEVFGERVGDR